MRREFNELARFSSFHTVVDILLLQANTNTHSTSIRLSRVRLVAYFLWHVRMCLSMYVSIYLIILLIVCVYEQTRAAGPTIVAPGAHLRYKHNYIYCGLAVGYRLFGSLFLADFYVGSDAK